MPAKKKTSVNIRGKKIGIVVSRFNEFITLKLLQGCVDEFKKSGVAFKDLNIVWVPGAFEIPVMAQRLANKKEIAAVICLGAVIRGETLHFELVAREASAGIMRVALDTKKPIIFGVLATDTVDQAYKRAQEKGDNKGRDAARDALEMMELFKTT